MGQTVFDVGLVISHHSSNLDVPSYYIKKECLFTEKPMSIKFAYLSLCTVEPSAIVYARKLSSSSVKTIHGVKLKLQY